MSCVEDSVISFFCVSDFAFFSRVLNNIDLRYNDLGNEGKGVIRDAVNGREGFKLKM